MARLRGRGDAGFTLVELVVAVIIFSFLAFVGSGLVSSVIGASASLREGASGPPDELSPVALLLRLAGVAVLLFGTGFWYMVELHHPGRLDAFRLGHFLLLGVTYSLFFVVFAVLGAHAVDAWLAVLLAAAVSYPLLALHVATIAGPRFAITSALPLALLTTGLVVNGVYGGELRAYVYLGMLCVVIAFTTLTYPRLAGGQERWRGERDAKLAALVTSLAPIAIAARAAVAEARALLALQDPVEHAALRDWVDHRVTSVCRALDGHELMVTRHDTMRAAATRLERNAARTAATSLATSLSSRLEQSQQGLREATAALRQQRDDRLHLLAPDADAEHCIACGEACGPAARYCPKCGTPCAEAKVCRRCDQVLRLPLHLLKDPDATAPATHCYSCGERHAG
ncbi:MAG: prepilin-type N-terminal cleavage/methylation domain-containing protein [Planctomycetes bacterium]|nr:prepilin-type N-terminal cleavage/methylation domain-containing protein [Planctomycetota bacterium]MCB9885910.1 prepilin-type N-terminal cleavage/methylation domain-containing protein [Planctomycetota bacterium]